MQLLLAFLSFVSLFFCFFCMSLTGWLNSFVCYSPCPPQHDKLHPNLSTPHGWTACITLSQGHMHDNLADLRGAHFVQTEHRGAVVLPRGRSGGVRISNESKHNDRFHGDGAEALSRRRRPTSPLINEPFPTYCSKRVALLLKSYSSSSDSLNLVIEHTAEHSWLEIMTAEASDGLEFYFLFICCSWIPWTVNKKWLLSNPFK